MGGEGGLEEGGVGSGDFVICSCVGRPKMASYAPPIRFCFTCSLATPTHPLLLCYPSLLFTRGFHIFIYSLKYKYKMEN